MKQRHHDCTDCTHEKAEFELAYNDEDKWYPVTYVDTRFGKALKELFDAMNPSWNEMHVSNGRSGVKYRYRRA